MLIYVNKDNIHGVFTIPPLTKINNFCNIWQEQEPLLSIKCQYYCVFILRLKNPAINTTVRWSDTYSDMLKCLLINPKSFPLIPSPHLYFISNHITHCVIQFEVQCLNLLLCTSLQNKFLQYLTEKKTKTIQNINFWITSRNLYLRSMKLDRKG